MIPEKSRRFQKKIKRKRSGENVGKFKQRKSKTKNNIPLGLKNRVYFLNQLRRKMECKKYSTDPKEALSLKKGMKKKKEKKRGMK